jgi:putative Holliday junction resolvase
MVVAGIDFGRKRIGVAISEGTVAYPLETVERRSIEQDMEAIRSRLAGRGVSLIIVGLPLSMDGTEGASAQAARSFAARIASAIGITVEMVDERLSSFEADNRLRGINVRSASKKSARNAVAAMVILERWLESHPSVDHR